MEADINGRVLALLQGDITEQSVDAIVNAANAQLAGGGGVDGAIHARGGPAIIAETDAKYPDGCPTGSAVASGPGELPCRVLLHAVGPIWHGGDVGEPEQLRGAYWRCLELAVEHQCRTVAMPALSTGAYGYPMNLAAETTIAATIEFLQREQAPQLVRIVLFRPDDLQVFEAELARQTA